MQRFEFDDGVKYCVDGLNSRMPPDTTLGIWYERFRRVPAREWKWACKRMVMRENGFPRGFPAKMMEYVDLTYMTVKEDHRPLTPEEIREAHRCAPGLEKLLKVYSEAKLGPLEMRRFQRFVGMSLADWHIKSTNIEDYPAFPAQSEFVKKHLGTKPVQEWMNHYLTNPEEIDYVDFPYELMYYREADVPSEDIIQDAVEASAEQYDDDYDGEI